jgi:mannosyltransferase
VRTAKTTDRWPRFILPLLGITLLGAALRFHNLGGPSIWLDEADSWQVACRNLRALPVGPGGLNPPLFDLLLHVWLRLFGDSESALRSLPALFGTAAIFLAGLVGRRLFDRLTGLLSALLLAIMVFPVHYAQDARPYSLLLAGTLASTYCYIRVLEDGRRRDWISYLLITTVLCYSHLYWVFIVLAQNIHRVFFGPRGGKTLLRWAIGQGALLLACVPWLVHLAGHHGALHAVSWIPRPGLPDLLAALRTDVGFLIPPGWLLIPAGLAILGLLELSGRRSQPAATKARSRIVLLAIWFLAPILTPFLLSQVMTPMFWPRYTIGAVPALYLLVARGATRVPGRWLRGAAILAVVVMSAVGLVNYYRFPGVSGRWSGSYFLWEVEEWREAVAFLAREMQPADVVLVAPEYARAPFDYYARDALAAVSVPGVEDPHRSWSDLLETQAHLQGRTRAWLVFRRHPSLAGKRIDEFLRAAYREIPVAWPGGKDANPAVALFDLARVPAGMPRPAESGPR